MLILSDTHLHSTHPVVGEDYLNLGISALQQIRQFAIENDEKTIIHLGDTFQLKDRIPSRVWNAFFQELAEWEKLGFTSYFLKGNHDYQTDATIEAFKIAPHSIPILTSEIHSIEEYKCMFVPYGEPLVKEICNFIFMHDYFRGKTTLPNDIVAMDGKNMEEVSNYGNYIIAGHSHKFQELIKDKVFHIGSPYQTTFNEVGQEKFFGQVKNGELIWHNFKFPEFKIVDLDDPNTADQNVEGCYLKAVYSKLSDADARYIKNELLAWGAKAVKLEPQSKIIVKNRIKSKKGEKIDYLQEYIKATNNGLNANSLHRIGIEIIEKTVIE